MKRSFWIADNFMKRGKVNDVNDVNALSEYFNNFFIYGAAKYTNPLQDNNVINNDANVMCDYEIIHLRPSSSSL